MLLGHANHMAATIATADQNTVRFFMERPLIRSSKGLHLQFSDDRPGSTSAFFFAF